LHQFPDDAQILALHAMALYRDERFAEAREALNKARSLDDRVAQFVRPEGIKAVEESRWVTPLVSEGLKLAEAGQHEAAVSKYRRALQQDPENVVAARQIAMSLLARAEQRTVSGNSADATKIVEECAELCRRFPEDAELHVAHAAALFGAGRNIQAADALQHAEALGGDVEKLVGHRGVRMIREAADAEAGQRRRWLGAAGVVGLTAAWLTFMFGMGTLLAVCTSRVPNAALAQDTRSSTAWRDRFYLVVLSLSLLVFYISVPFVALGLLAITVLLFALMVAMRFIHFGLLYRGLFATWGVIRCALIGPDRHVLGIVATQEQHPRLFAMLQEVACRLNTNPVHTVYLTPSSLIGVREDGSGPFGLFRRRRVMELGIATLPHLTTSEFKSILAHEYGHFTHQDPFYSRFISQVTGSLANSLAVLNAAGGVANYVNPFYWFYWLYLRAYALLAAGFSRSREYLADRRAVLAYGKEAFIGGLTKATVEGVLFEQTSVPSIKNSLASGQAFVNVFEAYRQFREKPELTDAHQQVLDGIRSAKPGWFDSHPTYSERLVAIDRFPARSGDLDTSSASSLLPELTGVEEQLTALLTCYIAQACGFATSPGDTT
jgi:Zn-dependent protease with chaperone function